jgi:hypothetical protein
MEVVEKEVEGVVGGEMGEVVKEGDGGGGGGEDGGVSTP